MAGTLTAANILARVNNILQNTGGIRWFKLRTTRISK